MLTYTVPPFLQSKWESWCYSLHELINTLQLISTKKFTCPGYSSCGNLFSLNFNNQDQE